MQTTSPHSFHIPVMGIAYTIDSPIKLAHFGINSAVSVIEDNLVELMRKYYYQKEGKTYKPIGPKEKDYRSRRVTDYLNLMQDLVQSNLEKLKRSTFETGSDLRKYFEMLPEESKLYQKFKEWRADADFTTENTFTEKLRDAVIPGAIEVNIMTKVDKDNYDKTGETIENGSDALTALKGYADSKLQNSSLVFSAGMNPRLYNYMESFSAFDAQDWGSFHKRVVIKVSDYRSALIQGKYLAKKGIWVSEFRIESGLNCGGHVFATQGLLMGPILEEFKENKENLKNSLFELYNPAIIAKGKTGFSKPHPIKITVQGGIGTHEEDKLLREYYQVDGTGWGTPFLLCPEATNVDKTTLSQLQEAKEKDVFCSKASPLGVGFNYLKNTSAEKERLERIEKGKPGSPCTEKLLVSNTEFTDKPICMASHKYQKLKLKQLEEANLPEKELKQQQEDVLAKECLCVGLSNSVALNYQVPFLKKQKAVTVCPGPNIANFSSLSSLQEMTNHIYGRKALAINPGRSSMFITELRLYIDFLTKEIKTVAQPTRREFKKWEKFINNLLEGIKNYETLNSENKIAGKLRFKEDLSACKTSVINLKAHLLPQAS